MTDAPTYAPGQPIWVDLGTRDLEGAQAFYSGLFGWDVMSLGPEAGGYGFFMRNGQMVGGMGPLQNPEQPPAWSLYIATADADATADAVRAAGGQVIFGPMDVMDAGRMAIFVDAGGAVFGVWQPQQHTGMRVQHEPGSYCWSQLNTRSLDAAKGFYNSVFGWEAGGNGYTEWKLDDATIGGAMAMDGQFPAEVPPHWLTFFATANADATVARAQELGAQVLTPVTEIGGDMGRFAVLQDPQGAVFGLHEAAR
jgi:predicted enzyme related to lactoylglutathione lyase